MAITWLVGSSAAVTSTGSPGQIAVPYPADVEVGDLLVLAVVINQTRTISVPSGWSDLPATGNAHGQHGVSGCQARVMVRVADGSESGTVAVPTSTFGRAVGFMLGARGVDTGDATHGPLDSAPYVNSGQGSAASQTCPASDPVGGGDVVALRVAGYGFRSPTSAPAGCTLLARAENATDGGGWPELAACHDNATFDTPAGSAPVLAWPNDGGDFNQFAHHTIMVRPAAAAGTAYDDTGLSTVVAAATTVADEHAAAGQLSTVATAASTVTDQLAGSDTTATTATATTTVVDARGAALDLGTVASTATTLTDQLAAVDTPASSAAVSTALADRLAAVAAAGAVVSATTTLADTASFTDLLATVAAAATFVVDELDSPGVYVDRLATSITATADVADKLAAVEHAATVAAAAAGVVDGLGRFDRLATGVAAVTVLADRAGVTVDAATTVVVTVAGSDVAAFAERAGTVVTATSSTIDKVGGAAPDEQGPVAAVVADRSIAAAVAGQAIEAAVVAGTVDGHVAAAGVAAAVVDRTVEVTVG